jgi:adenine-specific DNA-methyltransferase
MSESSLKKGRYTKFSNKIGLYSNSKGGFIKNDTDVVLNFPFKDAVLEAGMSKEDVGREERFLHIEVDSKDIDTLEEPKVFTDFRYIDKDGEKTLDANSDIEFFDTEGNLKQNLLIKGNNLLALYTLREKLAGKVKLIYIDPPYNTGGDGFRYNDSFNHSAWLTFMKNRLEVAKDLLRDDGVIFVQCDDNEQAYLKVLMDEIFTRENFVANFIWKKKGTSTNVRGVQVSQQCEYILSYSRTQTQVINQRTTSSEDRVYPYSDDEGSYRLSIIEKKNSGEYRRDTMQFAILGITPREGKRWQIGETKARELELKNRFINDNGVIKLKIYSFEDGDSYSAQPTLLTENVGSTDEGNRQLTNLVDTNFNNPKPENLMRHLIEIATNANDIVLDFCLGSGTTSAVAHKMNRRWVGIEQMDYIEDVAKERLKKVIGGERGGISETVNWNGGGSFVYFELKKYNQEYIDRIAKATSLSELEEIYVDMRNNAFLKFWFDRKEFEKDENFRNLDIEGRKQKLVDVLDENQLYLNYADMDDTRHKVTADEKTLTDKFYGSAKN